MMRKKYVILLLVTLGFALTSELSFAISLGAIADNLLGPTSGITKLMYGVSYVAGFLMLIMALLQFKAHRDNPSQVRLGTPVALLIFAIVFICIPIVSKYSAASEATTQSSINIHNQNDAPLYFGREASDTASRPHREAQQQPTRPQTPVQRQSTTTVPVQPDDSDWY